jgi:hypothetical protein
VSCWDTSAEVPSTTNGGLLLAGPRPVLLSQPDVPVVSGHNALGYLAGQHSGRPATLADAAGRG